MTENTIAVISSARPETLPALNTREDLAVFLDVPLQTLTYILYNKDRPRSSYYSERVHNKANGGVRLIHAVGEPLKKLQRTLLKKLATYVGPSKYAHGFVAERSIISNATFHVKKKVVIKYDMRDFFPSINFQRVRGMLLGYPFNFGKEVATTIAQLSCLEHGAGGLPQGGPLSPFFANMVCRRLDKRLSVIARNHRCSFTRYADDVTFSTSDDRRLKVDDLTAEIYATFENEGFIPNIEKTRLMRRCDRQVVTGVIVNEGLNVNRRYVNNLRATLFNCRKHGIEDQICRDREPRDPRSSRHNISRTPDGKWKIGFREVLEEEAVRAFLRHLLGKILFVGQIVDRPGITIDPGKYRRIEVFKALLTSYYDLVKKRPKYSRFREIVRKRMCRWADLQRELSADDRSFAIRRKALDEYRMSAQYLYDKTTIEACTSFAELEDFRQQKAQSDARFFIQITGSLELARRELIEILSWPQVDSKALQSVLESFRQSQDNRLGELTHRHELEEPNYLTGRRALAIIWSNYDPYHYLLPELFRRVVIDPFLTELSRIASDLPDGECFSPPDHPELGEACQNFKAQTRMGLHSTIGQTSIELLIQDIWKRLESKDSYRTSLEIDLSHFPTIYTSVPQVKMALGTIIESMRKHCGEEKLRIYGQMDADHSFSLIIESACVETLGEAAGRQFAHGKLRRVVSYLNGICSYYVTAPFCDGEIYRIDMLTGSITSEPDETRRIFQHRMLFDAPSQ